MKGDASTRPDTKGAVIWDIPLPLRVAADTSYLKVLVYVALSWRWLSCTIDHGEIMVAGHLKLFQTSLRDAEISTYLSENPLPSLHYVIKIFRRNIVTWSRIGCTSVSSEIRLWTWYQLYSRSATYLSIGIILYNLVKYLASIVMHAGSENKEQNQNESLI